MFCALLTSRYQVSVYRTNGPLVSLDPLKPHFYYISSGLRGSISHGDISMMTLGRKHFYHKTVLEKQPEANLKDIFVSPYPTLFLWYGSVSRKICFF